MPAPAPKKGGTGPLLEIVRGVRLALLDKTPCGQRVFWSLSNALQQSMSPDGAVRGELPALAIDLLTESPEVSRGDRRVPQEYLCRHEVGVTVLVERQAGLESGEASGTELAASETEQLAALVTQVKLLLHADPTLPTPACPEGPAAGLSYVRTDYDAEGSAAKVLLSGRVVFEVRYHLDVSERAALEAIDAAGIDLKWHAPASAPDQPTATDTLDVEEA